ncbi:MAG: hypothetical protein AB1531_03870 [Chloroflexota bacterium]
MFIEPSFDEIESHLKWRYLNSLDSIRYSPKELFDRSGESRRLRVEQASAEVISTILMGNGIAVPNNQFMDSVGFLRVASDMIQGASYYISQNKNVLVPLRYANYDYSHEPTGGKHLKTPFLLVAYLFQKDGKDGRNFFELSAWNQLAQKRVDVAKLLAEKDFIEFPPGFISDQAEYQLAEDLIRVLNFFTVNRNLIVDAIPVKKTREEMILSIAELTKEKLETENYFVEVLAKASAEIYDKRLSIMMDIITVFNNLLKEGTVDYRSKIREEIRDTNYQRFSGVQGSVLSARDGVSKVINSIYNFTGYISTSAEQESQAELMGLDGVWGCDEAAFTLGQWARINYEKTQMGVDATRDISSNQDSFVPKDLPVSSDESTILWKSFFDYQRSDRWLESIKKYMDALIDLARQKKETGGETDRSKQPKLYEKIQRYNDFRNKHIEIINTFLATSYDKRRYRINLENNKAILACSDLDGNLISKTQLEDFGEDAALTKEEKSARYAAAPAKDTTSKSSITDYKK